MPEYVYLLAFVLYNRFYFLRQYWYYLLILTGLNHVSLPEIDHDHDHVLLHSSLNTYSKYAEKHVAFKEINPFMQYIFPNIPSIKHRRQQSINMELITHLEYNNKCQNVFKTHR